jgi:Xaa-Pro aminopeptidase
MADAPAVVSTDRADRVAESLEEREADMLLVSDLVNVRWLTGFTGSNAAVVVGREGSRRFVTDFRYRSGIGHRAASDQSLIELINLGLLEAREGAFVKTRFIQPKLTW